MRVGDTEGGGRVGPRRLWQPELQRDRDLRALARRAAARPRTLASIAPRCNLGTAILGSNRRRGGDRRPAKGSPRHLAREIGREIEISWEIAREIGFWHRRL
mmetsp:Transcript_23866/g.60677  ORF Transcript_23866/g.60677 Transcript_23866/m.60677 type:complete len:102 (-) Transcript_23866:33-338(-)